MDLFSHLRTLVDFVRNPKDVAAWGKAVDALGSALKIGASWLTTLSNLPPARLEVEMSDEDFATALESHIPPHEGGPLAAVDPRWLELLPLLLDFARRFFK